MPELLDYGIRLSARAQGEYKTVCPRCSNDRKNKDDPCLSIKIEADGGAVWTCHHCGFTGGYRGSGGHSPLPAKQYKKPVIPASDDRKLDHDHLVFLHDRLISNETIARFDLYSATRNRRGESVRCIAFPYRQNNEIYNVKYRTLDKQFSQEKDAQKTLFGIDSIAENWEKDKTLVIVEGEMDVLALAEAGINAVTLPDGASRSVKNDDSSKRFSVLKDYEWLVDAEKVIIATDADEAGLALCREIEHRFGKDKCWIVDWPAPHKDANDYLIKYGREALSKQIDTARPSPIEGVYYARNYIEQVIALWEGKYDRPLSTGFDALDEIYTVMPSTFCLVTGIPNHGKSNFLDQIAVNMMKNHDWKFAIFSPEHSVANHIRRLSEKIRRKPFYDLGGDRMTAVEVLQAIDKMDDHFYFIEARDNLADIDWILSKVKVACLRHGINGVVIDPYSETAMDLRSGAREDQHIRQLISKCKSFCRHYGVAMWVVAHPIKQRKDESGVYQPPTLYDVAGAAHWLNMADVGLIVHRDFDSGEVQVITGKIREQGLYGHIGKRVFRYDQKTCSYISLNL